MQATEMGKISGEVGHENKCIHAKYINHQVAALGQWWFQTYR